MSTSLAQKGGLEVSWVLTVLPDTMMSFAALLSTLLIAVLFLATCGGRRWRRSRPIRILRVLFSTRYIHHRSHGFDLMMMLANKTVFGLAVGWLMLSGKAISLVALDVLNGTLGVMTPTTLAPWVQVVIGTTAVYLAYELGYWVDHYLSHRVPFLWEFHKVHHEAERLSPATVFRVHPIDTLVFMNIIAVTMGAASGVVHYAFGMARETVSFFNYNLIMFALSFVLIQLHHSHIWLPLRGWIGCIILSPAHHQIHHSTNPIHFNKNMGSSLAVFDWIFGTLHVPAAKRERLTFGVPSEVANPHTFQHGLVTPFVASGRHVWRSGAWLVCSARKLIGRAAVPGRHKLPQA